MPSTRVTLRQSLALVWRTLRSMRTALILLLLLALASVAGSLVPQLPNSPERVIRYQLDHPLVGALYDRARAIRRLRVVVVRAGHYPALRLARGVPPPSHPRVDPQPPPGPVQAREIDAFRLYEERVVPADPSRAIDGSRHVLRRRLFRVARDGDGRAALAAEKGALREIGSLLFHWAFLLSSSA